MTLLNNGFNNTAAWDQMVASNLLRTEVDLAEVERVVELARHTPGLAKYDPALRKLSVFFAVAADHYRKNNPEGLGDLVAFWDRYREAVVQRFSGVTPVELRAADAVVANIFDRFVMKVPNQKLLYDPEARPLVYGGEGGIYGYFTHPAGWNRPFAIINLPHAAFDNVWQWLALPHETGHDFFASVDGLEDELTKALSDAMKAAVNAGNIVVNSINVNLQAYGIPHTISYSGAELLAKIWAGWANESQADLVGLLSCGGAALVALQQIIEFDAVAPWLLGQTASGIEDFPEEHPTSYVRNALNLEMLKLLDGGVHAALAAEIESRFVALRPTATHAVWKLQTVEVARVHLAEMLKSAKIAADVLVNRPMAALGGKSYAQVATFTAADQALVEKLVAPLLAGDPTFAQEPGAEARHALAATMFAFEKDRAHAPLVNRTFMHFL
jgi:hypothetical protein